MKRLDFRLKEMKGLRTPCRGNWGEIMVSGGCKDNIIRLLDSFYYGSLSVCVYESQWKLNGWNTRRVCLICMRLNDF